LSNPALNGGSVEPPLAIDRVERARGQGGQVRLRLSGHWLTARDIAQLDALLVVQMHGRRHRFPASRSGGDAGSDPSGLGPGADAWAADFTVPDWAVPDQPGQASLWVGTAIVPVPPPGATAEQYAPEAPPAGDALAPAPPAAGGEPFGSASHRETTQSEGGRQGPLAEVLLKETVTALHAELELRATEAARLRGALAQVRSDLETRGQRQTELEAAHAELRHELGELMSAATRQRTEFDQRLSSTRAGVEELGRERGQAVSERDAALAERDRAREQAETARQVAESVRSEAQAARDEADAARAEAETTRSELARLRHELEGELAHVREETESRLATARSELDGHL
jgi:hypothetical protein